VKIEGNVITGTSSGVGKDIEHQYAGTDVFITSVKKGTDNSTGFSSLTGVNGGTVEAEFGTLTIRADGSYDYVLNSNDKTKALIEGQKVTETFTYIVKDAGGNESATTLTIEVTGVNDEASVEFKAGSTYSIASNLIRIDTGTDDIVVTDKDAGQAKFDGVSALVASNYDLQFGSLTLNPIGSANTSTSKGYAVSYVLNSVGNADEADLLRHDLFTLKSSDGTWNNTLDFVIGSTGVATKQEFHTSTVENLKIAAASGSTTDKVVLHGSQLAFDFTAPTSMTDSIEKIDITGTGNNTLRLSMASLTQADEVGIGAVHKLFVDGNSGDVVNIVNTSITADTSVAGYNRYVFDSTHELLVQQALTANFVS
jgi:VCBS repeat-containing protein